MRTLAVLLAASARIVSAQVDFTELDAAFAYALDEDGRMLLSPSPWPQDTGDAFTPIVRERIVDVLMNAGALGVLAYVCAGDTDLASVTPGTSFFGQLGRDSDVALLQALASGRLPAAGRLQRLLAVRAVQERGHKPALGLLERMVAEQDLDDHLREAVAETIADLRGRARPKRAPSLPSLADVLAEAPEGADLHVRINQHRLPPARDGAS